MNDKMSPERLSVRIDPETKERLKRIVKARNITISNYIRTLIKVMVEYHEEN